MLSQPTNVSMLVFSPVKVGFDAATITSLVTNSTLLEFSIYLCSLFPYHFDQLSLHHQFVFAVLMRLASSANEI